MKLCRVHEAQSCGAFMYLNSVGPWSDVPEDACSSGLVHVLHTVNLLKYYIYLYNNYLQITRMSKSEPPTVIMFFIRA